MDLAEFGGHPTGPIPLDYGPDQYILPYYAGFELMCGDVNSGGNPMRM